MPDSEHLGLKNNYRAMCLVLSNREEFNEHEEPVFTYDYGRQNQGLPFTAQTFHHPCISLLNQTAKQRSKQHNCGHIKYHLDGTYFELSEGVQQGVGSQMRRTNQRICLHGVAEGSECIVNQKEYVHHNEYCRPVSPFWIDRQPGSKLV
jgi:hypothetical protein